MTQQLLRTLVLIAIWLLLWRMAMVMEYAPHASIWFPPAALTLAAFLVMGARAWPAIIAVVVLSSFWINHIYQAHMSWVQLSVATGFFLLGHGVSYFLAAKTIQRLVKLVDTATLPVTLWYLLLVGIAAAFSAATIGAGSLILIGEVHLADFFSIWWPWLTGDMTAVLVLTPIFVAIVGWRYALVATELNKFNFASGRPGWLPYVAKLTLLLLTFALVVDVLLSHPEGTTGGYIGLVVMALLLPQLWIVLTERPFRTALSLGILSMCVAVSASMVDIRSVAVILQLSVLAIALISWLAMLIPMLAAANRELAQLANMDALTGVACRRSFLEQADNYLQSRVESADRRHEASENMTLLMFDLDHFKQVNDTHGHALGDQALHLVASTVQAMIRKDDLMGRFGGDEFLLLLHGGSENALELAGRIQKEIGRAARQRFNVSITLSFGVVELEPKESVLNALTRADALLFKAKRAGRARAMTAS